MNVLVDLSASVERAMRMYHNSVAWLSSRHYFRFELGSILGTRIIE